MFLDNFLDNFFDRYYTVQMGTSPNLKITFCGGVEDVTGSRHLIESSNARVLMDCGLFQGHRRQALDKNKSFPFDAAKIDAVLLSHAHIDHCGNLPLLVKLGFRGKIHCTQPTLDLVSIMLMDSAHLQEEDAKFFNKIHQDSGEKIEPLYGEEEVRRCLSLFVPHDYENFFEVATEMRAQFLDAGHVLGSAIVELQAGIGALMRRIIFTGDLGRRQNILMSAPKVPEHADYLILESTYGARKHEALKEAETQLEKIIQEAIKEKGKILIPSFALERTQEIIFLLAKLVRQNKIPKIPLYIDSPMATKITEIFERYPESFSPQAKEELEKQQDWQRHQPIYFTRSVEESKALTEVSGPILILSASGMCEGGRILHHLRNNIDKPSTTILIVGYQVPGTLGRQLVDGSKKVKIFGLNHTVMAQVTRIASFSAHADQDDLWWFVKSIRPAPKKIFLVHGDKTNRPALAEFLRDNAIPQTEIPTYNQSFELE